MEWDRATIYKSFVDYADALPSDELRGIFYTGILKYSMTGEEPDFENQLLSGAFGLIRPVIDKSNSKRAPGAKGGNGKQAASNPQANGKQTARDIELELELEIEKEGKGCSPSGTTQHENFTQSALDFGSAPYNRWTTAQFTRAVDQAVKDHPECAVIRGEFESYWLEQNPKGKPRLWLEKTWDTSRRLLRWYNTAKDRGELPRAAAVPGKVACAL